MYCGDETGAFIGDIGSHSSRFGYGGEDNPKYVIPSAVGGDHKCILTSAYHDRFDSVQPVYRMASCTTQEFPQVDPNKFLQQGDCIEDYDAYEQLWSSSFDVLRVRDKLKHTKGGGTVSRLSTSAGGVTSDTVQSSEPIDSTISHPLLAVSHGNTCIVGQKQDDDATRGTQYQASVRRNETKQITEILMEKLGAPATFIAPTPMLASFSHGRQTAMVVDMGAGGCRVTPVVDGLVLKHAQRRNGRGTDWLGHVCARAIPQDIVPRYQLSGTGNKSKCPWFHTWAMLDVMYEFRTSHHVSLAQWRYDTSIPFMNSRKDDQDQDALTETANSYELPDGTFVNLDTHLGKDLCRVPELLFTDELPFVDQLDKSVLSQSDTLSDLPLHKLVHASLTAVGDADARKELCGNILLCGGGSLVTNLEQRLSYELMTIIPSTHKCRVVASRNSSERTNAAWIGGSILTSLGSFQQLWLSQQEYQEYGTTLAIQRFP